ncbi:MAG TPA: DNA polymerase III subunit chi [Limnobacter sp.]|uniref:DNA polymerase III subunit chi n=1 Tax=Limnobacter sp. TaxID=2003368 RepID=UPI002ED9C728
MTRIDFHLNVAERLLYTCRLVRKAYGSGLKVVCFSTRPEVLEHLDKLMWTFSEEDFLPHVMTGHPGVTDTPIVLTDKADDVVHHDLLINLDEQWPPFFSRFERLVEIVGLDEEHKALARQRYKFYKDRGYPLNTFDRAGA